MAFIGTTIDALMKERRTLPAPLPGVPKPEDAEAKARSELAKRRRIIALSGGKTLLTSETAIGQKTLLGE